MGWVSFEVVAFPCRWLFSDLGLVGEGRLELNSNMRHPYPSATELGLAFVPF